MKFFFIADTTPKAKSALKKLINHYGQSTSEECDVFIVLGGDGFMLRTLHYYQLHNKLVYGINRGTVGFLLNNFSENDLENRVKNAQETLLHPLHMTAKTITGENLSAHAINEVSLSRQSGQAARLQIYVDNICRLESLMGDGLIIATPAGSTAYNFSAFGPILPIGCDLIALTPLNPFRPRRWRGAILPDDVQLHVKILEPQKRSVMVTADTQEVPNVEEIWVEKDKNISYHLLFDPHHNLEDRILNEQFLG